VPGADAVLTQLLVQRIDQGAHLPRVDGGGDDEVVSEGGHPANVQQHDLLGLAVSQEVNDAAGDVGRLRQRRLLKD
jgi:hypothetical protein